MNAEKKSIFTPRLYALCDAFCHLNGAFNPQTDAYRLRNPLLLKAFTPHHIKDEATGLRIFRSFPSGYDNGCSDLLIKCSGRSFCKIGSDSTLKDLVRLYGNAPSTTRTVKNFLQHALGDDSVSESTPLSWFLESSELPEVKE